MQVLGSMISFLPLSVTPASFVSSSPQPSSSAAAVPPDQTPALRSVLSVPAVERRWEMSQSAVPVLKSSTTAAQELLGRTKDRGHSSTFKPFSVSILVAKK